MASECKRPIDSLIYIFPFLSLLVWTFFFCFLLPRALGSSRKGTAASPLGLSKQILSGLNLAGSFVGLESFPRLQRALIEANSRAITDVRREMTTIQPVRFKIDPHCRLIGALLSLGNFGQLVQLGHEDTTALLVVVGGAHPALGEEL